MQNQQLAETVILLLKGLGGLGGIGVLFFILRSFWLLWLKRFETLEKNERQAIQTGLKTNHDLLRQLMKDFSGMNLAIGILSVEYQQTKKDVEELKRTAVSKGLAN